MAFDWNQPQVAAAVVGGVVAAAVGGLTVVVNSFATAFVAERKLRADRTQAVGEKAWADYGIRRDIYMTFAQQVDVLFSSYNREETAADAKRELLKTARKIRLVGSDQVVRELNSFFDSIKDNSPEEARQASFRNLFNAMRRDIRRLHALPPEDTDLDDRAFPMEA